MKWNTTRSLWILAPVLIVGCWSAPTNANEDANVNELSPSPFAAGPLPLTVTARPDIDTLQLEDRVHELINAVRARRGLRPLRHIEKIRRIARSHSEDMAARDYYAHTSPEGLGATDRGRKAGYDCRKDYGAFYTKGLAENIHAVWLKIGKVRVWRTPEELAQRAVKDWMESKGHRRNILKASFDRTGVGATIGNGKVFFTQNFC